MFQFKWKATLYVDGKKVRIGRFVSRKDAMIWGKAVMIVSYKPQKTFRISITRLSAN